jgi:glycosyltransferase involved in cell wall biosynthesis
VAVLSEYESQGLAIQEALTLGRPLVVTEGTALGELERHANVRALPLQAGSDVVAAAIVELLQAAPSAPPPLPTWDDCANALLQLYEETLDGDRLNRAI